MSMSIEEIEMEVAVSSGPIQEFFRSTGLSEILRQAKADRATVERMEKIKERYEREPTYASYNFVDAALLALSPKPSADATTEAADERPRRVYEGTDDVAD